jgi:hypothetical protein
MSDIDDLRGLLGFGPYRGAPVDWDAAGRALGASVPADFRELVDAAGPGKIGYDTLLLQPAASDRRYDQIRRHRERMEDLQIIWEDEEQDEPEDQTKPQVFNEAGVRPILWATSGLGFNLFWVARDGVAPSSWRIAVEPARGGEWEFHAGTATNLLVRLLRGEEPTTYLSSLASADQHSFTPAE